MIANFLREKNMESNPNKNGTAPLWWLNATQFLGAMNDNVFKMFIIFALTATMGGDTAFGIANIVFALPFLMIAGMAGILADRYSKRDIILATKILEMAVMLVGVIGFWLGWSGFLFALLFAMGVQTSLFGPSKLGIVPELVPRDRLSRANSLLVMFTYLAIILGTAISPVLAHNLAGDQYAVAQWFCVFFSVAGILAAFMIRRTEPVGAQHSISPFVLPDIYDTLKKIWHDAYLLQAVIASAYFFFLGAFLQSNIFPYGIEYLELTKENCAYLFSLGAFGIAFGAWAAGKLSGRHIEFGLVPLGAFLLTLSSLLLNAIPPNVYCAAAILLLAGLGSGLFVVPLHAFIQDRSKRELRGKVLGLMSFMSWVGVLLAGALLLLFNALNVAPGVRFTIMGFLTLVLTIFCMYVLPDFFIRFIVLIITRIGYSLRVLGHEHIPIHGSALLVSNHASYVDALLIIATQQRRVRFIMTRDVYESWTWLHPFFKLLGCIPISIDDPPRKIVDSIREARAALDEGYLVCIFAEGGLTRTGTVREFKRGMETILTGTSHPIIPVYLGGSWGTIASYYHGHFVNQWPAMFRYPATVIYGAPLPSDTPAYKVREAVMELSCAYFNDRKSDRKSLAEEFIVVARQRWNEHALRDTTGRDLTYGKTLTAALALAEVLKKRCAGSQNVGVLLPPSVGGVLANVALTMLDKIPVNLDFTASSKAFTSSIRQCGIHCIVTSRLFLARMKKLPVPTSSVVCLEDLIEQVAQRDKILAYIRAAYMPRSMLTSSVWFQADNIATVIFSSGSTGEPKGVMLSHHNILSNIESLRMVFESSARDNLCAALPFFHSLGYTATLWYPLLSGLSVTYHANPLDVARIAEIVRERQATMIFATPTFLQLYMQKVRREDFQTLKYVVVGAEKLNESLARAFEEKFGIYPLEGYGATELAPVATLSLPHYDDVGAFQTGWKKGSVGMPLPGVAVKVVDLDSGESLPPGQAGLLLIKGPNVMLGYLHKPDLTEQVLRDGWYDTGDIACVEEDGFVRITDRLARFSKIGGEMIPHMAVEDALHKSLGSEQAVLAVSAARDEKKGEKLVVLYTEGVDEKRLYKALTENELPNLWRPSREACHQVDALPLLGSGKLDLKTLKQKAIKAVAAERGK